MSSLSGAACQAALLLIPIREAAGAPSCCLTTPSKGSRVSLQGGRSPPAGAQSSAGAGAITAPRHFFQELTGLCFCACNGRKIPY